MLNKPYLLLKTAFICCLKLAFFRAMGTFRRHLSVLLWKNSVLKRDPSAVLAVSWETSPNWLNRSVNRSQNPSEPSLFAKVADKLFRSSIVTLNVFCAFLCPNFSHSSLIGALLSGEFQVGTHAPCFPSYFWPLGPSDYWCWQDT